MRKITISFPIILILVFIPGKLVADWTEVSVGDDGTTSYIDFDRIRKNGGYVYYWVMSDWLEPTSGVFSDVTYHKGDCDEFKTKWLTINYHKEPMGQGELHPASGEPSDAGRNWRYPVPKSVGEKILNIVCSQ